MVGGVGLLEYRRSAGAVHGMGWPIVWCPRYRRRVIVRRVADRLRELLLAKAAGRGWSVEALGLRPNLVHLFVRTPPDPSAARVAHQVKGCTPNVLRSEFGHLGNIPTFWSKSYFVASVGRVSEAMIRTYIGEQTTRPIWGEP
jgi:putative transposase